MFKLAIREILWQHCLSIRLLVASVIKSWSGHTSPHVRPDANRHPLVNWFKNKKAVGVPAWNDIDWFLSYV